MKCHGCAREDLSGVLTDLGYRVVLLDGQVVGFRPARRGAQPPNPPPATQTSIPAPIAPPPPPADQPTQTIEIGQTVDQVVAALGQPQKIAKVGTKQIYFYKDLKVTFNNGKVSDVE